MLSPFNPRPIQLHIEVMSYLLCEPMDKPLTLNVRLRAVSQDGHASEEIERSERKSEKQEAEGKLSPVLPSLDRDCSQSN